MELIMAALLFVLVVEGFNSINRKINGGPTFLDEVYMEIFPVFILGALVYLSVKSGIWMYEYAGKLSVEYGAFNAWLIQAIIGAIIIMGAVLMVIYMNAKADKETK